MANRTVESLRKEKVKGYSNRSTRFFQVFALMPRPVDAGTMAQVEMMWLSIKV
jgi:hypothetical protein